MADTINWSISPTGKGASINGSGENATVTFDTNYKTATTYTVTCTSGTHKGTFIVKRKGEGCSGGGGGGGTDFDISIELYNGTSSNIPLNPDTHTIYAVTTNNSNDIDHLGIEFTTSYAMTLAPNTSLIFNGIDAGSYLNYAKGIGCTVGKNKCGYKPNATALYWQQKSDEDKKIGGYYKIANIYVYDPVYTHNSDKIAVKLLDDNGNEHSGNNVLLEKGKTYKFKIVYYAG